MSLQARIESLALALAQQIVAAVRESSLEEILGAGSVRRGPGRPPRAAARHGAKPAHRKAGRLARRSTDDIAKALGHIVALLKKNKKGLRAEQIGKALRLDRRELPRPLKEGLKTKKLSKKGRKRSTTYFA